MPAPLAPSPPAASAAAEALAALGAVQGVSVCFANPGTTEIFFSAALAGAGGPGAPAPRIRTLLALHETVATGAADGFFRVARRPAATLLHLGVGLMNGLSQLHNARRARSTVVVRGPR